MQKDFLIRDGKYELPDIVTARDVARHITQGAMSLNDAIGFILAYGERCYANGRESGRCSPPPIGATALEDARREGEASQ